MKATAAASLTKGYIQTLKARGAEAGVWAVRGRVFARIMVAARDSRLSGAEWSVLSTIALHLQHLGRSKGMMSLDTLADDCMVTPRTVRNALRMLKAARFVHSEYRSSGTLTLRLDARFGPRAPVPGDKSVDKSPRRSAARKNISTKGTPLRSVPSTKNGTDSAAQPARVESPAAQSGSRTPHGYSIPWMSACQPTTPRARLALQRAAQLLLKSVTCDGPSPPPRGRPPGASG